MKYILFYITLFTTCLHAQDTLSYKSIIGQLTDSSFHGRGYVNNGDKIAANYLSSVFNKIGAKPLVSKSYFQNFKLDVNTFPKKITLKLDGEELNPGYDYLVNAMSGSANGSFEVKEIKLENIISKEKAKALFSDTKGKAFYINPEGINDADTLKEFMNLQYALAKVAPVIVSSEDKLMWSVGRVTFLHPIIELKAKFLNSIPKQISLDINNKFINGYETQNVIGYVKGKKHKKEYIIICGHYDHLGQMGQALFPGGNDNASGTAGIIEMMKYYVENPHDYSIMFIAFGGEEAGLVGSKYYVENPIIPLAKTKFVLDLDIMGSADEGITVVNGKEMPVEFAKLERINEEKKYLPIVKPRGKTNNSDHAPFYEKGVPAFFIYTVGSAKKYHEVEDNLAHLPLVNFKPLTQLLIDYINTIE